MTEFFVKRGSVRWYKGRIIEEKINSDTRPSRLDAILKAKLDKNKNLEEQKRKIDDKLCQSKVCSYKSEYLITIDENGGEILYCKWHLYEFIESLPGQKFSGTIRLRSKDEIEISDRKLVVIETAKTDFLKLSERILSIWRLDEDYVEEINKYLLPQLKVYIEILKPIERELYLEARTDLLRNWHFFKNAEEILPKKNQINFEMPKEPEVQDLL